MQLQPSDFQESGLACGESDEKPCLPQEKEEGTMVTISRAEDFVYEVSSVRDSSKKDPTVSKELMAKFKALAEKYLNK